MRMNKERINVRLPEATLKAVEQLHPDATRTQIIENALRQLLKDLHHDAFPTEFVATLLQRDAVRAKRQMCNLRIDRQFIEYIRLNQYNLTTCITTALKLYVLP